MPDTEFCLETQEGGDTDPSLQRLLVHCGKIFPKQEISLHYGEVCDSGKPGVNMGCCRVIMDCWEGNMETAMPGREGLSEEFF